MSTLSLDQYITKTINLTEDFIFFVVYNRLSIGAISFLNEQMNSQILLQKGSDAMKLSELNIIKYEKNRNTVTFLTNCSARIVVTFISDRTARLYVDFDGNLEPDKSYAIETFPQTLSNVELSETAESYIVSAKELSVRLRKNEIRIDYLRNSTVLSSEKEIGYNNDGSLYCVHDMTAAEPKNVTFGGRTLDCHAYKRCVEKAENSWFFDRFNKVLYIKLTVDVETPGELLITNGAATKKLLEDFGGEKACGKLPFLLPPASAPCRINCENYDRRGEGVSYHKLSDTKSEIYRMDSVIIELCDDIGAGYNIKNMVGGEWLEYTINVRKACKYVFRLRIHGSARISIGIDSRDGTEIIETSGDKWQTVSSAPIELTEGEQVIQLLAESGKLKANWIEIEEA